jgi:hypothetical protein
MEQCERSFKPALHRMRMSGALSLGRPPQALYEKSEIICGDEQARRL